MRPLVSMREALADPALLGSALPGPSWTAWRAMLIATMGEPLDDDELAIFRRHTGRDKSPSSRIENVPEDEKKWHLVLDGFGFSRMDEFDAELLDGIKRGYFDEGSLGDRAKTLDELLKSSDDEGSLHASWRLYHDLFKAGADEVAKTVLEAFYKHVRLVTPLNLSGTVKLLKDLGRQKEAKKALAFYMAERDEAREFFDLDENTFGDDIDDPEVRQAFEAKYNSFKDERLPKDVLKSVAKKGSASRDDVARLVKLSEKDFYTLFKEQEGEDLSRIVRASLMFQTADPKAQQIAANAKAALIRIAKESPLNRRRVKKFEIEIPPENDGKA